MKWCSEGLSRTPPSGVRFGLFGFDGFFDFHVVKLFGIKDFATFQAFNKFYVVVPGDDADSRVFADGRHGVRVWSWSVLIFILTFRLFQPWFSIGNP